MRNNTTSSPYNWLSIAKTVYFFVRKFDYFLALFLGISTPKLLRNKYWIPLNKYYANVSLFMHFIAMSHANVIPLFICYAMKAVYQSCRYNRFITEVQACVKMQAMLLLCNITRIYLDGIKAGGVLISANWCFLQSCDLVCYSYGSSVINA